MPKPKFEPGTIITFLLLFQCGRFSQVPFACTRKILLSKNLYVQIKKTTLLLLLYVFYSSQVCSGRLNPTSQKFNKKYYLIHELPSHSQTRRPYDFVIVITAFVFTHDLSEIFHSLFHEFVKQYTEIRLKFSGSDSM